LPLSVPKTRASSSLLVAAAVVTAGLGMIVWFPRQTPVSPPPLAVNISPVPPDLQRWGAMYEELSQLPLAVHAPLVLPDGSRMTSMSVWRPGWYGTGVVWNWLFEGDSERWALVEVDPTVRHKVASDEAQAVAGFHAIRIVEGVGGLVTLEWDAPGYAMTIHGEGASRVELLELASGIVPPDEASLVATEPPEVTAIPDWMRLVERTGREASTAGPGEAGWQAGYLITGGERGRVTVTAAEGRALPFDGLLDLSSSLTTRVRGLPALGFDYPGASSISRTTTRSRLLWVEEGVMVEAEADRLTLAELAALVENLELIAASPD
jgi:hypothetical protein